MDKKLLFLTKHNIEENVLKGGELCSKTNYDAIAEVFGNENITIFRIHNDCNLIKKYWDYLFNRDEYSKKESLRIRKYLKENVFDFIYFDGSWFGNIAKYIVDTRLILFLHNVEKQYSWDRVKKNILTLIKYKSVCSNEREIIDKANYIFALNQRDNQLLKKYYDKTADMIWPITIEDSYTPAIANTTIGAYENNRANIKINNAYTDKISLLFVGSYFSPNVEGVRWFVEKVIPNANCELTVAGKGMEKLKFLESDKIRILGTIENLLPLYESADAVIIPIFSGGGMKVKTAEALMYGKKILATDEALIGYDKEQIEGIVRCNTAEEFITAVNECIHVKYHESIRAYFLDNFENKIKVSLLKEFIWKNCLPFQ